MAPPSRVDGPPPDGGRAMLRRTHTCSGHPLACWPSKSSVEPGWCPPPSPLWLPAGAHYTVADNSGRAHRGAIALKQPILNPSPDPRLADLTPRELEVFLLIAQGHSNREISAALTVEETTVKNHVRNVLTSSAHATESMP